MRVTTTCNELKRTIFVSGVLEVLQMVQESVIRKCNAVVGIGLERTLCIILMRGFLTFFIIYTKIEL